jgi:rare lipoprotein A (peptidoglycan hydrolase)
MALEAPRKAVQRVSKAAKGVVASQRERPVRASVGLLGPSYKKAPKTAPRGVVTYKGIPWQTGGGSLGPTSGQASYYWQGSRTASGETFKPDGVSCAHRTLPFGTKLRVTNQSNGKSVVCRVNDRGPFIAGRIVDLSRGAARQIGMLKVGVVPVTISIW